MPPADYDARELAITIDEPPEDARRSISPTWHRRSFSRGRPGSPVSQRPTAWYGRIARKIEKLNKRTIQAWNKLTLVQKIALVIAGITLFVMGILFLIYQEAFFRKLAPYAKSWRELPGGWLIIWFGIVIVSFPPLIGYSSLLTAAGFVFGFPNSWFIAASATVVGSTLSFIASRHVLKDTVNRLVAKDSRFAALSLTLKHDGIKMLVAIRLCPLPYSLSNGAIATIPTVHWTSFAIATAIASLKLLLHVFVGARLGEIAEKGEEMDSKTKTISYLSAAIGGIVGFAVGIIIYQQTKARARELEALEAEGGVRSSSIDNLDREYADDPDTLAAAELLRDDDDISLHSSVGLASPPYRDETSSDDPDDESDDGNDVLRPGRDEEAGLSRPK